MCGRYQLQVSADAIAASHRNTSWRTGHSARFYPRQQFRPTNHAPVVVAKQRASSSVSSDAEIVIMKWGMFPAWSAGQRRQPLINARRETLLKLPTFRNALRRKNGSQRCAVPATGFYEWHKEPGPGKPTLTPYLVQMGKMPQQTDQARENAEDVRYMAGVYECEGDNDGEGECSFVIITTEASKEFRWLHDRQPVFLTSHRELDLWLDNGVTPDDAVSQLRTESGLSWVRMTKDLSEAAKGKTKVQRGLDSFFKQGTTAAGNDEKAGAKSSPRKKRRISTESLLRASAVRKEKKSPSRKNSGKQKTLSSFFQRK